MLTAKFLNAWPEMGLSHTGEKVSRICLELIGAPAEIVIGDPKPHCQDDYNTSIILKDTKLIMAQDSILVADGLIRRFGVETDIPGQVLVTATTEHPSKPEMLTIPGDPYVIHLIFPRKPVTEVLAGLRIGIDPGHGGKDGGHRGPVNLLEKDVALAVARDLQGLLEACDAVPVMTRTSDIDITAQDRLEILTARAADICVEIHTSGDADPNYQEYKLYAGRSQKSKELAAQISHALFERMGINLQTMVRAEDKEQATFPVVRVEPICLTHYVDEANFRAPLFQKRIAQSIFNGIHRFFAAKDAQSGACHVLGGEDREA